MAIGDVSGLAFVLKKCFCEPWQNTQTHAHTHVCKIEFLKTDIVKTDIVNTENNFGSLKLEHC